MAWTHGYQLAFVFASRVVRLKMCMLHIALCYFSVPESHLEKHVMISSHYHSLPHVFHHQHISLASFSLCAWLCILGFEKLIFGGFFWDRAVEKCKGEPWDMLCDLSSICCSTGEGPWRRMESCFSGRKMQLSRRSGEGSTQTWVGRLDSEPQCGGTDAPFKAMLHCPSSYRDHTLHLWPKTQLKMNSRRKPFSNCVQDFSNNKTPVTRRKLPKRVSLMAREARWKELKAC